VSGEGEVVGLKRVLEWGISGGAMLSMRRGGVSSVVSRKKEIWREK